MASPTTPALRFWLPVLPIWVASLVALLLAAIYAPLPALLAALVLLGAALGCLEGILLALDLGKVRLYRQRADRLQAVFQVIRKAGSSLDLQEVLEAITRLTVEVTGVRGCSVKLWDTGSGTMRVRAMAGIARQEADLSVDVAQNISHRSLMEGKPVLVVDALIKDFPEVDDQTESLICVPLRHERQVLGALCVYGERGGNLSQEMIAFFSALGDLVTLSIANASVYENLKRLNEAKTWFLLKAAHELRSPLGAIQSMARTLSQGLVGPVGEEPRRMIQRIEARAASLDSSVGDLLLLAGGRAELSTSELKEIHFCSLLEENLQTYAPLAEEKGVRLQIQCPAGSGPRVYGRMEGIRSIVANLLSNAIKYTRAGGTVSVSAAESGEDLLFEVRDTGIGIPAAEQDRLFSEFFRASNARQLAEVGTGLGLAIVKATVDQHGGRIEVESREGEGTTFRVYLRRVGK